MNFYSHKILQERIIRCQRIVKGLKSNRYVLLALPMRAFFGSSTVTDRAPKLGSTILQRTTAIWRENALRSSLSYCKRFVYLQSLYQLLCTKEHLNLAFENLLKSIFVWLQLMLSVHSLKVFTGNETKSKTDTLIYILNEQGYLTISDFLPPLPPPSY